ncbi:acylneuraminate cytidylyltransferase family protein [Rufibacter soli]
MLYFNTLVVIPARGGSKGIPGKNIKPLAGKPLICYAIDAARTLVPDAQICVSTDDAEIIKTVEGYGLRVPFKRPDNLATDTAGSYEVLIHALEFYEKADTPINTIVLLQPTSPFRRPEHVKEAVAAFTSEVEMVVSVKESPANPYYSLFEENKEGFLIRSKSGKFTRRQDCPKVFEYNGAVYVINTQALKSRKLHEFQKVKKYVMDELSSIDVDTPLDWKYCEFLLKEGLVTL